MATVVVVEGEGMNSGVVFNDKWQQRYGIRGPALKFTARLATSAPTKSNPDCLRLYTKAPFSAHCSRQASFLAQFQGITRSKMAPTTKFQ